MATLMRRPTFNSGSTRKTCCCAFFSSFTEVFFFRWLKVRSKCVEKQWCKIQRWKVFQSHLPVVETGACVVAESSRGQKSQNYKRREQTPPGLETIGSTNHLQTNKQVYIHETHTHTRMRVHAHIHPHITTDTHRHTHTHTNTHSNTHTSTQTNTENAHTHTNRRAHEHTQTQKHTMDHDSKPCFEASALFVYFCFELHFVFCSLFFFVVWTSGGSRLRTRVCVILLQRKSFCF